MTQHPATCGVVARVRWRVCSAKVVTTQRKTAEVTESLCKELRLWIQDAHDRGVTLELITGRLIGILGGMHASVVCETARAKVQAAMDAEAEQWAKGE